ncbi:MAG: exodeoxyribonuclease VII large subunit [Deltaproteobacteria bacterium]|nr:exodeoxyribonuclease VII large subunit [Deltaproteobacteria bacterium]
MFDDLYIYTVSQLNRDIRLILEDNFSSIWVEGEISNFRRPQSGHFYFTLKDDESQIRAVMFRHRNSSLGFTPADGDRVLCLGKVSLYEPRGEYQVIVDSLELKGLGALLRAFEELKARLAAEGLFAEERKKPIPLLPRHVVVITSATGAAIRDILQVVRRRFAGLTITLIPATVQGSGAAAELVRALRLANEKFAGRADVVILARGGGSWEDLAPFNDETLAREIFASRLPVISAVGHEVDFTIADFVADLRAPTPSAAAELVVAKREELEERLAGLKQRLEQAIRQRLAAAGHRLRLCEARLARPEVIYQRWRQRVDELGFRFSTAMTGRVNRTRRRLELAAARLAAHSPTARLANSRQQLAFFQRRLRQGMVRRQEAGRHALELPAGKLAACNPLAVLRRGYAVVTRLPAGEVVSDAAVLSAGDRVRATFARGRAACRVEEVDVDQQ